MRNRYHLILPIVISLLLVYVVYTQSEVKYLTDEEYLSRNRQIQKKEIHRELEQDDAMLILSNYLSRRYPTNIMDRRRISEESILLPYLLPSEVSISCEMSKESDFLYDLIFSHKEKPLDQYNMAFYSTFTGYHLSYSDQEGLKEMNFDVFIDKKSHDIVLFTMSTNVRTASMVTPKEAVDKFISTEPIFFNRKYERIDRDEGYFRSIIRVPSLNKTYLISFIDGEEPKYVLLDYRFVDEFYQAMNVLDVMTSTTEDTDSRIQ